VNLRRSLRPPNLAQEQTDPRRYLLWEDRLMRGEGPAAQRRGCYAERMFECATDPRRRSGSP
jgi:hypothetical protein